MNKAYQVRRSPRPECTSFAITQEGIAPAGHRGSDARLIPGSTRRTGGPTADDVCRLRLDDQQVAGVLDTLAKPACGAD